MRARVGRDFIFGAGGAADFELSALAVAVFTCRAAAALVRCGPREGLNLLAIPADTLVDGGGRIGIGRGAFWARGARQVALASSVGILVAH